MSWIHLPADDSSPAVMRLTKPYRDQGRKTPAVVAAMKPNPAAMRAVLQMNAAVTFGGSTLGQYTEELIATATSALNQCFY
jgi:hypothetical protein